MLEGFSVTEAVFFYNVLFVCLREKKIEEKAFIAFQNKFLCASDVLFILLPTKSCVMAKFMIKV